MFRLPGGAAAYAKVWTLIEGKNASAYDSAVALLVDLRALAERLHRQQELGERMRALRALYSRRPSLLDRLTRAGLP
jgi:hypothetical protein